MNQDKPIKPIEQIQTGNVNHSSDAVQFAKEVYEKFGDAMSKLAKEDCPDVLQLRECIERSWNKDTTYSPDFYEGEDPAFGQCAVTALVVSDYLGGDIVVGEAFGDGVSTRHYWNRVNGIDLDLTWRQFPAGTQIRKVSTATREYLLYNEFTRTRYQLLLKDVSLRLNNS